jgi:hypothetical protein
MIWTQPNQITWDSGKSWGNINILMYDRKGRIQTNWNEKIKQYYIYIHKYGVIWIPNCLCLIKLIHMPRMQLFALCWPQVNLKKKKLQNFDVLLFNIHLSAQKASVNPNRTCTRTNGPEKREFRIEISLLSL